MAGLLYGSGLRLMECLRLRVKDVDFGYAFKSPSATARADKDRRHHAPPVALAGPLQRGQLDGGAGAL